MNSDQKKILIRLQDYLSYPSYKRTKPLDIDGVFRLLEEMGVVHWNELTYFQKKESDERAAHRIVYDLLEELWYQQGRRDYDSEQEYAELLYFVEKFLESSYDPVEADHEIADEIFFMILRDFDNIIVGKVLELLIANGVYPKNGGFEYACERYVKLKETASEQYLKSYEEAVMDWWKECLMDQGMEYHQMSFETFVETKEYQRFQRKCFVSPVAEEILEKFFRMYRHYPDPWEQNQEILEKEEDFLAEHFPAEFSAEDRKAFWRRLTAMYRALGSKERNERHNFVPRYLLFLMAYGYTPEKRKSLSVNTQKILGTADLYEDNPAISLFLKNPVEIFTKKRLSQLAKSTVVEDILEKYGDVLENICIVQEVMAETATEEQELYQKAAESNRALYEKLTSEKKEREEKALEGAAHIGIRFYLLTSSGFEGIFDVSCPLCGGVIDYDVFQKIRADRYGVFKCPFCGGKLYYTVEGYEVD